MSRVPGYEFDSLLGDNEARVGGAIAFNLYIRVHVRPHQATQFHELPDNAHRQTALISPELLQTFKREFQSAIHTHWNNKLWLHPLTRNKQRANAEPIKCGVNLEFVDDVRRAQLTVLMVYAPTGNHGYVRAHEALPSRSNPHEVDMVLGYYHSGSLMEDMPFPSVPTSDRGNQPFAQNTASHELGHYLQLPHRCFKNRDRRRANADPEYCVRGTHYDALDLMALGNEVRDWHVRAWRDRLQQHRYRSDLIWIGATSAAPPG